MPKNNKVQFWRSVFCDVIEEYQHIKSITGTLSAINYEVALDGSSGGSRCSKVVRPSLSDFVCDVETAARRALSNNKQHLKFFLQYYVAGEPTRFSLETNAEAQKAQSQRFAEMVIPSVEQGDMNNEVMAKVGRIFLARRRNLCPVRKQQ